MSYGDFFFDDDFNRRAWKQPTPEEIAKQEAERRAQATRELLEEMDHKGSRSPRAYMVSALLKEGADPEARSDFWQRTPLDVAAGYHETEIVKILVKGGARYDDFNPYGHTPFQTACGYGYLELVEYFIGLGVDVNRPTADGQTPIIFAAVPGCRLEAIQILIAAGSRIEGADSNGKSVFDHCREGKDDYRSWGGTYNWAERRNEGGRSGRAVYTELERLLLDEWFAQYMKQGKPLLDKKWASTVLNAAAAQGDVKIAAEMIRAGADPNMPDAKGTPALLTATLAGDLAMVECLVAGGGNLNQADPKGNVPFSAALARDDKLLPGVMLAHGVDVNLVDAEGTPPLVAMTKKGDVAMMERLIVAGADINKPDKFGHTPLMAAVLPYNAAVVKLLLDLDAEVEPQTNSHQTVLSLARNEFGWKRDIDGRPSDDVYAELKTKLQEMAIRQAADQFRTGLKKDAKAVPKIALGKSNKPPPAPTALRLKKPKGPPI